MATMEQTEARLNGVVTPIWNAVLKRQNRHRGEFLRYVTLSKSHFLPVVHKRSDSAGQGDLHPDRAYVTDDSRFSTVSLDTFYPQITDNPIGVRIAFAKILEPSGAEWLKMTASYVYEDDNESPAVRTGRERHLSNNPAFERDWFDNPFLVQELEDAGE